MSSTKQNIDIRESPLPKILARERHRAQWTQAELADKAGLSYRTVHDLELGKRDRVQEKTLLLLAQALDISLDKLLGQEVAPQPPPTPEPRPTASPPGGKRRRIPRAPLLVAGILLAVALGLTLRSYALRHAKIEFENRTLTVRDGLLGNTLWSIGNPPGVRITMTAPWSSTVLLVALRSDTPACQKIYALDLANGDTLWTAQPDYDAIKAAFGPHVLDDGMMGCSMITHADLDGDGIPELIAGFNHTTNYPYALLWVDRTGRVRGQYAHQGHVLDTLAADIDNDGKDELIASGTNNAHWSQGPTVFILDENHFRGASVDSVTHPRSTEPDSALCRLVLPVFPAPYMKPLHNIRLSGFNPRVTTSSDGRNQIVLNVRYGRHDPICIIMLGLDLVPQRIIMDDVFLGLLHSIYPDSLIAGTGPGDPAWMQSWLSKARHFEAGHWPPAQPVIDDQPAGSPLGQGLSSP